MEHGALDREIGRAAQDETAWPGVIDALSRALGASAAYMISPLETSGPRSFGCPSHVPEELIGLYFSHFHQHDLIFAAARERDLVGAGAVVTSADLVPDELYRQSTFYNEFLRRYDLHSCLGCILTDEDDAPLGPRTHIGFWRPPQRKAFSYDDERRLASVVPQLRLALTSHWKLRSLGLLGEWSEQLLAQIEQAFFLLSRGGALLYANQAGLNMVRDSQALALRDAVLCRGDTQTPLTECFDARTEVPVELGALAPDCPAMKIVPLKPTQNTRSMFRWFPRAAYMVLPQAAPASEPLPVEQAFASRYGLTPAEVLVLSNLVKGQGPQAMAEAQQQSVHTVRAHLAHIFAKTGFRNQRELLAAVLGTRSG